MTKEYLITLAINFFLFHGVIYNSDVDGLLEYLDSLSFDQVLQEYLSGVDQLTNQYMKTIKVFLSRFKKEFLEYARAASWALSR